MSVESLCLVIGCAIPVLFVVGGTVLAVRGIPRFFGSSEAEEWEEDDLLEWDHH